jgi:hypothetical protein
MLLDICGCAFLKESEAIKKDYSLRQPSIPGTMGFQSEFGDFGGRWFLTRISKE